MPAWIRTGRPCGEGPASAHSAFTVSTTSATLRVRATPKNVAKLAPATSREATAIAVRRDGKVHVLEFSKGFVQNRITETVNGFEVSPMKVTGETEKRECRMMDTQLMQWTLPAATRCPDYVIANAGSTGYYRVRYQGDLLGRLQEQGLKPGATLLSEAEKAALLGELTGEAGRAGQAGPGPTRAPACAGEGQEYFQVIPIHRYKSGTQRYE